jgi:hypothetical protein
MMLRVLLENADTLEAVVRPIVGERRKRVGKPAGIDSLVQGEMRHEVTLVSRLGRGKRTRLETVTQLRHGINVPANSQIKHRSARPEGVGRT